MYAECARHGFYSLDDLVAAGDRDELSQATLYAASELGGLDWVILEDLRDQGHDPGAYVDKARSVAPWLPYRADLLLHAAPPDGHKPCAGWAAPFRDGWDEIRAEITRLRDHGFTTTHRELREIAAAAFVGA